jgi:hypothetical protein
MDSWTGRETQSDTGARTNVEKEKTAASFPSGRSRRGEQGVGGLRRGLEKASSKRPDALERST